MERYKKAHHNAAAEELGQILRTSINARETESHLVDEPEDMYKHLEWVAQQEVSMRLIW